MPVLPLAHFLGRADPVAAFRRFADVPGAIFLDSADRGSAASRYAFIGVDPFTIIEARDDWLMVDGCRRQPGGDPFLALRDALAPYRSDPIPGLPPFQGGAAGWLGYDLGRHLERIPPHRLDDQPVPDLAVGLYDLVLAFDVSAGAAWVVATGFPEVDPLRRQQRAVRRVGWALDRLGQPVPPAGVSPRLGVPEPDLDAMAYGAMVGRVIDYIQAGDIYQANVSTRFRTRLPAGADLVALYERLRCASPAPFGAFVRFGDTTLLSASPERFLQVRGDRVETRPIKGTRPRGGSAEQDAALRRALLESEKDRAENLMIVDLLRNDLSRVCRPGTVRVPSLFAVETYATVHHLVSTVTGRLEDGCDAIDLLRAAFPGGSVTGAPKIRAMEIIAELEPNRRGPYCGAIGYLGFDGAMDTSIAIRTVVCAHGVATFQVGGGVVADSDPAAEHQEAWDKARGLMAALGELPAESAAIG